MKTSYLISLAVATLLLTGCGGSSRSDTLVKGQTASTTIKVQRGPILGAKVVDVKGQVANETAAGEYTFTPAPSYPILVTGGVIDMDRDGKVSKGDVVNDMNLSTVKGSVVTLLTTLAANVKTKTEIDILVRDLNLTQAEIYSETPTDSKKVEAISNVIYKYAKVNNLHNLLDTNATLNLSSSVKTEYNSYMQDAGHSVKQTEQDLVTSLDITKIQELTTDAEVTAEQKKLKQKVSQSQLTEIENHLSQLKNDYERENSDLEYSDHGAISSHYQGANCTQCHSSGEHAFTSGATIFISLNANNSAAKAANNYSLRLVLAQSGDKINYGTGRGSGNAYARFNAGVAKYTAQVLNVQGVVVNSSATDSHDTSRFDCNKCHTATGINGAPGRIVSFSYTRPTTPVTTPTIPTTTPVTTPTIPTTTPVTTSTTLSFVRDILPILNTNCKGCHGSNGNFSITSSATPYAGVTPFVTTASALDSKLIQKGSGGLRHGGGTQLTSTEFITIRDWITQGAKNN